MTRRGRPDVAVVGAVAEPDVATGTLEVVPSLALERGFELEDAEIGPSVSLAETDAPYGRMRRVRMAGVALTGARLRSVDLGDVVVQGTDASNLDLSHAFASRVRFADCRMTGVDMAEAELREVTFRNCKLDYANFRMATLASVTFEDCTMVDVDFAGSKLAQVRFSGCELREAEFANARLAGVDLRGSELSVRGSATALRGAIVSPLQLMELAPVLALEAGIQVED